MSDDQQVKAAREKLTELEQKFDREINRPVQAIEDDIRERAQLLLSGKPPKPKIAPDEIWVLKRAVGIALENYQEAQKKAAEKIIMDIEPNYKKVRESLLEQAVIFKIALETHDSFVQQLWQAGLFNFLPASWSLKASIIGAFPGGRLDIFLENLRL